MWLLLWCLNSRLFSGPIWNNTNVVYEDCADLWWPTFLFLGNIVPGEMYPYKGCLQQAFPLQIDLQLTLIVPFFAILAFKYPTPSAAVSPRCS